MLRNDYTSFTDRISFSLDIIMCDHDDDKSACETNDKIKEFINKIFIT